RMPEHLQEHGAVIVRLGNLVQVQFPYPVEVLWTDDVALVYGGIGEVLCRYGADHLPLVDDAQVAVVRYTANYRPDELVAFGELYDLVGFLWLYDGEHSLLGLGDHYLPRRHAALAQRHLVRRGL